MVHVQELKNRTGAMTESLDGGGAARSGFASWSSRVGSSLLRLGAEGPELPQQSFRATVHGLGSGSGTLAACWLQQAVEVDAGVAKVDVGEDPRQRCRRQDTCLGLGRGAKAKGDIFKSTNQEGKQLGGAVLGASQRALQAALVECLQRGASLLLHLCEGHAVLGKNPGLVVQLDLPRPQLLLQRTQAIMALLELGLPALDGRLTSLHAFLLFMAKAGLFRELLPHALQLLLQLLAASTDGDRVTP